MKGLSPIAKFDKLEIFPIGSIYTSISSTSPATLFGGTWEQIQGRFLLSASSSYAAGGTGGASTVNLSHVHSTGNHTLTVSQMPSHNHYVSSYVAGWDGWPMGDIGAYYLNYGVFENPDASTKYVHRGSSGNYQVQTSGGNAAHNHGNTGSNLSSSQSIMPPYLTVSMWKRTA